MKNYIYIFISIIIYSCSNSSHNSIENLGIDTVNVDISFKHEKAIKIYPNDSMISDSLGNPIDSLSEYHLPYDTLSYEGLNHLYIFNEPILSNYYLGQNHLRYSMLAEHGFSLIIHLSFDSIAGNIRTILYKGIHESWIKEYENKGLKIKNVAFDSSLIYTIAYFDTSSILTTKELEPLLKTINFNSISQIPHRIKDPKYLGLGTFFDLEIHTKDYYHYIERRNRLYLIEEITQTIERIAIMKGHPFDDNIKAYTTIN